jgi:hypothetical protein
LLTDGGTQAFFIYWYRLEYPYLGVSYQVVPDSVELHDVPWLTLQPELVKLNEEVAEHNRYFVKNRVYSVFIRNIEGFYLNNQCGKSRFQRKFQVGYIRNKIYEKPG